jgi:hypothetical protein
MSNKNTQEVNATVMGSSAIDYIYNLLKLLDATKSENFLSLDFGDSTDINKTINVTITRGDGETVANQLLRYHRALTEAYDKLSKLDPEGDWDIDSF